MTRHLLRTLSTRQHIIVRNALHAAADGEPLSTLQPGLLKWYSCGPTVYDDAHLGHARAYVTFDILRRLVSNFTATAVDYALGVTDIDDKIVARAAERQMCPRQLARNFEQRFFDDMAALNVIPPTRVLRVTEHVGAVTRLVHTLETDGAAYAAPSGNVYFSVASCGDRYGQLDPSRGHASESTTTTSHLAEGMEEVGSENGAIVAAEGSHIGEKRDVRDFALWKRSRHDEGIETRWPSRWGVGRPGWHVECSAMALRALGPSLDLHTGGIDLRFPHHTNELATAEAFLHTGGDSRWVHTWLHAGHLHMSGRKMSKSLKNFVTIRDFLEQGGSSDAFRIFCLSHRYAVPVELSRERVEEAEAFLRKVRKFLARDAFAESLRNGARMEDVVVEGDGEIGATEGVGVGCVAVREMRESVRSGRRQVEESVADDFNTPRMVRVVGEVMRDAEARVGAAGGLTSGAVALAYDEVRRFVVEVLAGVGVSTDGMGDRSAASAWRAADEATELLVRLRRRARDGARKQQVGDVMRACDDARDEAWRELRVRIADERDGSSWWRRE